MTIYFLKVNVKGKERTVRIYVEKHGKLQELKDPQKRLEILLKALKDEKLLQRILIEVDLSRLREIFYRVMKPGKS